MEEYLVPPVRKQRKPKKDRIKKRKLGDMSPPERTYLLQTYDIHLNYEKIKEDQGSLVFTDDEEGFRVYYMDDMPKEVYDKVIEYRDYVGDEEQDRYNELCELAAEKCTPMSDHEFVTHDYAQSFWRTESVWFDRKECEDYIKSKPHEYGELNKDSRCHGVLAKGSLATMVKKFTV